MKNKEQLLFKVNSIKGINELNKKGDVYLVGGIVRDLFLNKQSKDIDLVVCKLELSEIKDILLKYGEINEVGESFGVLKYKPNGWLEDEDLDISLPRVDKKVGDGHKGIQASSDPNLPIEIELERRDFTINSIAMTLDGRIIDPFKGMDDLKNKVLRATSNKAFSDDPLRMKRAIQFSSRFGFKIEENTWKMITTNKSDIKHITGERILTELEKIFQKGDIKLGLNLLMESGLGGEIFPNQFKKNIDLIPLIKTRADFFFFLVSSGKEYMSILKGDEDTAKAIDALIILEEIFLSNITTTKSKSELRHLVFNALIKSKTILDSGLVHNSSKLLDVIMEFSNGLMPKNVRELALNGHDLLALGLLGAEIGQAQKRMLSAVFNEQVKNTKESLTEFLGY